MYTSPNVNLALVHEESRFSSQTIDMKVELALLSSRFQILFLFAFTV